MSLMAGVAAASTIVYNGPMPASLPPLPGITYTVAAAGTGGPVLFQPFYAVVPHAGVFYIHLVNQDGAQHGFILMGSGMYLTAPGHAAVTMLVYLHHPGPYVWINAIPYPGVPAGVTVGIINVQ
ncbi:MAG: hypothetical protein L3K06_00675, partial [Thermoplasmata archaeon]|nr:hypothetical protein [Thermoplasmata archaeon]